jgi:hypothetical protein
MGASDWRYRYDNPSLCTSDSQPPARVPETVLDQLMPAPDEAPLTWCPWCGSEYNVQEQDSEPDYQDIACPHEGTYPKPCEGCDHWLTGLDFCNIPKRHKCGHLVRFVGLDTIQEDKYANTDRK